MSRWNGEVCEPPALRKGLEFVGKESKTVMVNTCSFRTVIETRRTGKQTNCRKIPAVRVAYITQTAGMLPARDIATQPKFAHLARIFQ